MRTHARISGAARAAAATLSVGLALLLTSIAAPDASAAAKARWLSGVYITEYYAVPESWFRGRQVAAPGLTSRHRIDWLYSSLGVTMQGTGLALDGRFYHVSQLGIGGWVDQLGRPGPLGAASFWRAGGFWRNASGQLTFPLEAGGWSRGPGRTYVPLRGVSFAAGHGQPELRPYRSIAVDPGLIPMNSRVYIPAYRGRGGGWFTAQDTGGAIRGRHIDVYRSPPNRDAGERSTSLRGQRILVVPPGARAPAVPPPGEAPDTGGGEPRDERPRGGDRDRDDDDGDEPRGPAGGNTGGTSG